MKFRKKRLRLSVLLVITSLIAGGCSSRTSYRKAEDRYVVGVVTKSNTSEYWMSVNSGMEAAAAKYDMDVRMKYGKWGEFLTQKPYLSDQVTVSDLLNQDISLLASNLYYLLNLECIKRIDQANLLYLFFSCTKLYISEP